MITTCIKLPIASLLLCIAPLLVSAQVHAPGQGLDRLPVVGDESDTTSPLASDLSPALRKRDVEKAIVTVADWALLRVHGEYNTDWTMGALYTGLMAASDATKNSKYRDAMKSMGVKLNWQLGPRFNHADDQVVGQTYLELYMREQNPAMIAALGEQFDRTRKVSASTDDLVWWWCDALFMAPPAWVRMYKVTGNRAYLDYMNREWWTTSSKLWDPAEHLFSRDASYLEKKEKNGRKIFWSRGNGWVMGGLVRVLQYLPKNYATRPKFVAQFREMAEKIKSLQGEDGLWRPGLLDAASYPLPETSGSAFFTYALAWGVNEKILDSRTYKPVVERAWTGLLGHVYSDGRLGCVQPVGAAPDSYKPTSSYVFGAGAFLLAGSEVRRMAQ